MAFASYAKGKEKHFKVFLPHLLFVRLMFIIVLFLVLWLITTTPLRVVVKELYITCTSSQSLILEILVYKQSNCLYSMW